MTPHKKHKKKEKENTPHNFKVCARQNVPAKHFKICHISAAALVVDLVIHKESVTGLKIVT